MNTKSSAFENASENDSAQRHENVVENTLTKIVDVLMGLKCEVKQNELVIHHRKENGEMTTTSFLFFKPAHLHSRLTLVNMQYYASHNVSVLCNAEDIQDYDGVIDRIIATINSK